MNKLRIILLLLGIFSGFYCANNLNDNPIDPNFNGDYHLSISKTTLPDTLYTDTLYRLPLVTGKDTFLTIGIIRPGADTINLTSSVISSGKDSVSILFVKSYSGSIVLRAVQPNGKEKFDSVVVTVKTRNNCPAIPIIRLKSDSIVVSVNDPVSLTATDSLGTSINYSWKIIGLGRDTNSSKIWNHTFSDTGAYLVTVSGTNQCGLTGQPDTAKIFVHHFSYRLTVLSIPDTIRIKKQQILTVGIDNPADFIAHKGSYYWHIEKNSVSLDTNGPNLDTLKITLSDSCRFLVRVFAADTTGNKSAPIERTPVVWLYRPICSFASRLFSGGINDPVNFSVNANDANADGSIADIKYRVKPPFADTTTKSTAGTKTFSINFPFTGSFSIETWAVDNEGLSSGHDSALVAISAGKPYFPIRSLDTTFFINVPITFNVIAQPGATGLTTTEYLWRQKGKTDTITTIGTLTRSFNRGGPDTLFVRAKNSQGDTSLTSCIIVVKVDSGVPQIKLAKLDTNWIYMGGTVSLRVSAKDTNGTIRSIVVDTNGKSIAQVSATTNSQLIDTAIKLTFPIPGKYPVKVLVRDNDNLSSVTWFVDTVTVDKGAPVVTGITPDTAWLFDTTTYTINATDNKAVTKWFISPNGTSWSSDNGAATFKYAFSDSGKQFLYVKVQDGDGNESTVKKDSVWVKPVRPIISSINVLGVQENALFINQSYQYSVSASILHGAISKIFISWNGSTTTPDDSVVKSGNTVIDTFTHFYPINASGLNTIRTWAVSTGGLSSVLFSKQVTMRLGRPVVDGITPQTIWVNDDTTFTITSHDTNGTVDSLIVAWGDGTAQIRKARADLITHKYATSQYGSKTVKIVAKDNDGFYSDTASLSITVNLGKPVISGISSDTNLSKIFINDPVTFTISYSDPNGSVDSISVDNGNGVYSAFVKATTSVYALSRTFTKSEVGNKTVRAIVKDNDGVLSDTTKMVVSVRLGAPVIDSMHIANPIWINDDNTYQVAARDTNGTIIRYYFDWTNSGTWQDSMTNNSIAAHYSTAGTKTLRYGVMDNDSNVTIATKQVVVHLGMPRVWNASGDTQFVVCPTNGGTIKFGISHYDTNGTFQQFYWNFFGPPYDTNVAAQYKTISDSVSQSFTAPSVNVAQTLAVYGKDDDGNVAGDTIWYYPDAPPPAPTLHDAETADSVTIYWKNKDVHDGSLTQFRILLHDNNEPDSLISGDIISNWKSSYRVSDLGIYDYMFRFKGVHSVNLYYYQVHARDARGSVTPSTTGHSFSF